MEGNDKGDNRLGVPPQASAAPSSPEQGPESNNTTHMGFQQTVMYGEYSKALGELAKKEAREDMKDSLGYIYRARLKGASWLCLAVA